MRDERDWISASTLSHSAYASAAIRDSNWDSNLCCDSWSSANSVSHIDACSGEMGDVSIDSASFCWTIERTGAKSEDGSADGTRGASADACATTDATNVLNPAETDTESASPCARSSSLPYRTPSSSFRALATWMLSSARLRLSAESACVSLSTVADAVSTSAALASTEASASLMADARRAASLNCREATASSLSATSPGSEASTEWSASRARDSWRCPASTREPRSSMEAWRSERELWSSPSPLPSVLDSMLPNASDSHAW